MGHQLNGGGNFNIIDNSIPLKCDTLVPRIINKVALTSGNWEVLGRNIWVDRARQLVYFLGLKETPLEKHLYAVSLQKPDWCRLLTVKGFSYTVEFNDVSLTVLHVTKSSFMYVSFQDCSLFLQTYCNLESLPTWEVVKINQLCSNGGVGGLKLISLGYLLQVC
jgi:dipeptidyl-peptidase 9